jgi:hypothetical protein
MVCHARQPEQLSPPLLMVVTAVSVSSTLRDRIADAYAEDPLFANYTTDEAILKTSELARTAKRFIDKHTLRQRDGLWYRFSSIAIPADKALRADIVRECHERQHAGHGGVTRTTELVERTFWWKSLRRQVYEYVTSCHDCQTNKASNRLPGGEPQPLQVPDGPWSSVSLDLITALPKTKRGSTAIVVFVDRLTKMTHFVATTDTVTAEGMADIFVNTVFRLHGMPKELVSDRDTRFQSAFWRDFTAALDTKLCMSTAYHPQSDGQTERMNRTLEDMLRHYVNPTQDDWDECLGLAEFAINNAWQASIKCSPFYANYGFHPFTPFTAQLPRKDAVPSAQSRLEFMHEQLKQLKQCLLDAQSRQIAIAKGKWREVSFKVGEEVLLNAKNIRLKTPKDGTKKLQAKWLGPYKVIDTIGKVAYKLALPDGSNIHNVFHVSMLRAYKNDGTHVPPTPVPVEATRGKMYDVHAILDHRDKDPATGRTGRQYLVHWEGYDKDEPGGCTWEPARFLSHNTVLKQYLQSLPAGAPKGKAGPKRQARPATPKAPVAVAKRKASSSPADAAEGLRQSKRLKAKAPKGAQ